jgi:hypothetical protein
VPGEKVSCSSVLLDLNARVRNFLHERGCHSIRPLARMGYMDYTSVESIFPVEPVGQGREGRRMGLEGRPKRAR